MIGRMIYQLKKKKSEKGTIHFINHIDIVFYGLSRTFHWYWDHSEAELG